MKIGSDDLRHSMANILGFDEHVFMEYLRLSALTCTGGDQILYTNLGKYLGLEVRYFDYRPNVHKNGTWIRFIGILNDSNSSSVRSSRAFPNVTEVSFSYCVSHLKLFP